MSDMIDNMSNMDAMVVWSGDFETGILRRAGRDWTIVVVGQDYYAVRPGWRLVPHPSGPCLRCAAEPPEVPTGYHLEPTEVT